MMIKKGDAIAFKPEWSDAGDTTQYFAASDEYDGRVMVTSAVTESLPLPPVSVVPVSMIEGR
jgi:hypothetical protein